jgi:hypothetical protein
MNLPIPSLTRFMYGWREGRKVESAYVSSEDIIKVIVHGHSQMPSNCFTLEEIREFKSLLYWIPFFPCHF